MLLSFLLVIPTPVTANVACEYFETSFVRCMVQKLLRSLRALPFQTDSCMLPLVFRS